MKLNNLFNRIEAAIPTKAKVFIGLVVLASLTYNIYDALKPNDPIQASVKITNYAGNSGGTGVILTSHETHSEILTNGHVCEVVKNGGLVTGLYGSYMVESYKMSKLHDLCLVTVRQNLGINTKVASTAPITYYEQATVSGHPSLFPTTVTTGRFSGKNIIDVLMGFKPCTAQDVGNPDLFPYCMFFGGIPIIKTYESTLVTATIQPGSSGSAIYNSNMELTGIVFAGSGNFGFAWSVPYELVTNFIYNEIKSLTEIRPNTIKIFGPQRDDSAKSFSKFKEICAHPSMLVKDELKYVCSVTNDDLLWRN